MTENLIGLSLSQCIADLIMGHVHIDRVKFLYTGTRWDFPIDLDRAAERYGNNEWSQDPELAREYLFTLWEQGKIIQPRRVEYRPCLDDHPRRYLNPNIANGHWAIQVTMP